MMTTSSGRRLAADAGAGVTGSTQRQRSGGGPDCRQLAGGSLWQQHHERRYQVGQHLYRQPAGSRGRWGIVQDRSGVRGMAVPKRRPREHA